MDELARVSKELETVNLLIIHHRQHPKVVARLAAVRARLLTERARLQAMRAILAESI